MKLKKFNLFVVFILLFFHELSAQNYTLNGFVQSEKSGERLIGAYIEVNNMSIGASTNEYGYFKLTVLQGNFQVLVHCIGYTKISKNITFTKDTTITFALKQKNVSLEEINVTALSARANLKNSATGVARINPQIIRNLSPQILGETDLIKTIQSLPGIQGGREGSADLNVRGGDPGQNLLLLDGIPVYNATHLLGMLSVFNTDAIRQVNVFKGGFPARYGGRLSSIVDIRLKEGNKNKLAGSVDLGVISSKLTMEGQIDSKSTFLFSGRFTPITWLSYLGQKLNNSGSYLNYQFYDITAKLNRQLNKKNKIFLSLYTGHDGYKNKFGELTNVIGSCENSFGIDWGNKTGLLRWNRRLGKQIFVNTGLMYSRYNFNSTQHSKGKESSNGNIFNYQSDINYGSGIEDLGINMNMDVALFNIYSIRVGSAITFRRFTPNAVRFNNLQDTANQSLINDTLLNNEIIKAIEIHSYIENKIKLGEKGEINVGLHYSIFTTSDTSYKSFEPRISIGYKIFKNFALKASYSQMVQYLHLLGNSAVGVPTDLWVPSTRKVLPENSWQATLGGYGIFKNYFEYSIELYYKEYGNLIDFSQGTDFLSSGPETDFLDETNSNWQDRVQKGIGKSYGSEFSIRKTTGKLQGAISYTLSKSDRQFNDFNNGEVYPYKYDRRHSINFNIVYNIKSSIKLVCNWVFMSGFYVSLPRSKYPENSFARFYDRYGSSHTADIAVVNERNNFQMPAYHRLDISAEFHKQKRRGERIWSVGIYNLYNRQNVFNVFYENNYFEQISLFPILPSFSYRYIF